MATATAMYHSGKNPLRKVTRNSEEVHIPKGIRVRRLHKALLRYHDANNWPLLREALRRMGRADLIGNGKQQLVPTYQPIGTGRAHEGKRRSPMAKAPATGKTLAGSKAAKTTPFKTQHTGLPRVPPAPSGKSPTRTQRKGRS